MKAIACNNIFRFILSAVLGIILFAGFSVSGVTEPSNPTSPDAIAIARQYYENGDFSQAVKILEAALGEYQDRGELLPQVQVMSLLSLTQQKRGNWQTAKQLIDRSLSLLSGVAKSPEIERVEAQIFNTKGYLELATGKVEKALYSWQKAEIAYKNVKDRQGTIGSRINQAQALEQLGFYRRSCHLILQTLTDEKYTCEQIKLVDLQPKLEKLKVEDFPLYNFSLHALGDALLSVGKLSEAETILELAKLSPSKQDRDRVLLSLGNVDKALAKKAIDLEDIKTATQYNDRALSYYQQAIQASRSPEHVSSLVQLQAQLNQLSLLLTSDTRDREITKREQEIKTLISQIEIDKTNLPLNRSLIYAKLNFAHSLILWFERQSSGINQWQKVVQLLQQVAQEAIELDDKRSQSYALGTLGKIGYEHGLSLASSPQLLLEKALQLAEEIEAPEIAYRWQWQLGRIYNHQSPSSAEAIASYQAAIADLRSLRNDLAALDREIQFSFQEQVEPVYRELVELLLPTNREQEAGSREQGAGEQGAGEQGSRGAGEQGSRGAGRLREVRFDNQKNLKDAREAIEALQIAELDNYFKDACAPFRKQPIDNFDPNAAIIYTISLPERLEVIVSLPNGRLLHHSNFVTRWQVEQTLEQLQEYLKQPDRLQDVEQLSQIVYSWLIAPFAQDLEINSDRQQSQIKTLVFVLDALLKNIPMSALYDGKQYLLQRYAIAVTPGLRLLKAEAKNPSQRLEALITGISQAIQIDKKKFTPLEKVEAEVKTIQALIPGETLLNSNLTKNNLEQQLNLKPFSLVHIATHGQFSSDPDKTFILLWNELLNVKAFNNIFLSGSNSGKELIDLLVLSACETALGDKRAGLGLAGIAVRSGTRSTLATLWDVNDESTSQVMIEFYRVLSENPALHKAEALRQAQLKLWQNRDRDWQVPFFWASYVLVGEWI